MIRATKLFSKQISTKVGVFMEKTFVSFIHSANHNRNSSVNLRVDQY